MTEVWWIILGLALGTFAARLAGVALGARIPQTGFWARALTALPGALIVALVAVNMMSGGPAEWAAGAVALCVAILTRNLPLTMIAGILAIVALRNFT